ncbi:MAG: 4-alpha-glucanotransferase, partial [Candidatus Omnitrophica bacterium]|nr:4-alpha-glucanotransferase [Candidatus Omnitrophota bacterium]
IKAEMGTWDKLKDRVLKSLAAPKVSELQSDVDIKLNANLTDEEFEGFLREGLNEMSFTRAPNTRETRANARVVAKSGEAPDSKTVRNEIVHKIPSKKSGVLMHISSLDGNYGIGDFGMPAREYVDFLVAGRQNIWQILPINAVDDGAAHSPYSAVSSFALDPLFVSPELLVEEGLLTEEEAAAQRVPNTGEVNFEIVEQRKSVLFDLAFERRNDVEGLAERFADFRQQQAAWLEDYVLFLAIRRDQERRTWHQWPADLRDRQPEALRAFTESHGETLDRLAFEQFILFEQWNRLHAYAAEKGVEILGDIPLYTSYDSADVWANPELFDLNDDKQPRTVSGAPPDVFSDDGQRWGHPTFRWDVMLRTGYAWWRQRLAHNFSLFDQVRLDHFRGLVGYWEIPAEDPVAKNGQWQKAADDRFFQMLRDEFGIDRFIAEDLGDISDDVKAVISKYGFRTMKVLQFGFDQDSRKNPYHPRNHVPRSVVYTGTHDTNTLRGWFKAETDNDILANLQQYLAKDIASENVHWEFIRMALESSSETAIVPMQDILGLGEDARMNLPGTIEGNWAWRVAPGTLDNSIVRSMSDMKKKHRPKQLGLFKAYSTTSLEVAAALEYLRKNNYLLLANRLQSLAFRGFVREGEFTQFAATVFKAQTGEEYIMVSGVNAEGDALSFEERVANLVFAVGATAPFQLPVTVNQQRADDYLDQAVMADDIGGIDLNPDQLLLDVRGQAVTYQPALNGVQPVPADIHGFVPVIINIVPLQSSPLFFGGLPISPKFETSLAR